MSISLMATGDTGVAPAYGKNADGSSSLGLLDGISQLGNALGAAAPFVAALNKKDVVTNANGQPTQQVANATAQNGQSGYFVPTNGQVLSGMTTQTKVLLGVGAAVLLVGVILIARKS